MELKSPITIMCFFPYAGRWKAVANLGQKCQLSGRIQSALCIHSFHIQIQPTKNKKYSGKKPQKFPKSKTFATPATIYIAFTLYLQQFT